MYPIALKSEVTWRYNLHCLVSQQPPDVKSLCYPCVYTQIKTQCSHLHSPHHQTRISNCWSLLYFGSCMPIIRFDSRNIIHTAASKTNHQGTDSVSSSINAITKVWPTIWREYRRNRGSGYDQLTGGPDYGRGIFIAPSKIKDGWGSLKIKRALGGGCLLLLIMLASSALLTDGLPDWLAPHIKTAMEVERRRITGRCTHWLPVGKFYFSATKLIRHKHTHSWDSLKLPFSNFRKTARPTKHNRW